MKTPEKKGWIAKLPPWYIATRTLGVLFLVYGLLADGGASKYSAQVLVADRIRAALSKALPNAGAKEAGK